MRARSSGADSIMRWEHNYHLFVLGLLAFGAAHFGRAARRRRRPGWARLHITGMGSSYVLLVDGVLRRQRPPVSHVAQKSRAQPRWFAVQSRHPTVLAAMFTQPGRKSVYTSTTEGGAVGVGLRRRCVGVPANEHVWICLFIAPLALLSAGLCHNGERVLARCRL